MKKYILLFIVFFISFQLFAQVKDSTNQLQLRVSTEYLSNYLYNGRADSLKSPYSTTSVEIKKGGFTLNASSFFLLQTGSQRFDYFELDGSYEHDFSDKFTGGINVSKYFNSNQRTSINSDITSLIGAYISNDFNFFKISTESDMLFSSKYDFYTNIEIDKEMVKTINEGKFSIDPTIDFNFSTSNYYEGTITRSTLRKNKKVQTTGAPVIVSTTSVLNSGFRFMDFEISLPLSFEKKHFSLSFTPTFSAPFNSIKTSTSNTINGITSVTDSTPFSERFLKNFLSTNFSISYKF